MPGRFTLGVGGRLLLYERFSPNREIVRPEAVAVECTLVEVNQEAERGFSERIEIGCRHIVRFGACAHMNPSG